MAGQSRPILRVPYLRAMYHMAQQKNLSPLNLSRLAGCSYQTAKKYLEIMVQDGHVEVYRSQYRPNVIAKIYQWIETENG